MTRGARARRGFPYQNRDPFRETQALVSLDAEIRFAREVTHENVVKLVDCFATAERVYLVLEHGGRDLYAILTLRAGLPEDHLTEAAARCVGRQLVAAVGALAAVSLAHGDVKPEHVLVDADNRVALTDLGSCRRFGEGAAATTSRSSLGFAAPEALLGRPFDPFANDVFSVGAVLLECLVGVRWFAEHWLPVTPEEAAARAGPAAIDDGRRSFRSLEDVLVWNAGSPAAPPVLNANAPGAYVAAVAAAVAALDRPLAAVRATTDAATFLRDALCVDVAHRPTAEALAEHAWFTTGPLRPPSSAESRGIGPRR